MDTCDDWFEKAMASDVTPENVRDALVNCFICAHKGSIVRSPNSEQEIERIRAELKHIFIEADVSFEHPSKEGLMKVCRVLGSMRSHIVSVDTVNEHFGKMMNVLERL